MHQVPPHARPTPCHAFSQLPSTHHLAHARRHACARPHTRAGRARARARRHIGDGAGGRSRRLRPPAGSRPQLRGARRPSGSRASRRRSTRWWRSRGPALTPMAGKARKDQGASNVHQYLQRAEKYGVLRQRAEVDVRPQGRLLCGSRASQGCSFRWCRRNQPIPPPIRGKRPEDWGCLERANHRYQERIVTV